MPCRECNALAHASTKYHLHVSMQVMLCMSPIGHKSVGRTMRPSSYMYTKQ